MDHRSPVNPHQVFHAEPGHCPVPSVAVVSVHIQKHSRVQINLMYLHPVWETLIYDPQCYQNGFFSAGKIKFTHFIFPQYIAQYIDHKIQAVGVNGPVLHFRFQAKILQHFPAVSGKALQFISP